MVQITPLKSDSEHEKCVLLSTKDNLAGIELSIRSADYTYRLPCSILCDCLRGTQSASIAHHHQQLLTCLEETSILLFCNTFDDYGYPVNM
jgi:hypothetical protein